MISSVSLAAAVKEEPNNGEYFETAAVKEEPALAVGDDSANMSKVTIKTEPDNVEVAVKAEPMDCSQSDLANSRDPYDGLYRPAPVVSVDSDSEYEDESDDSAPDDDDVEAQLGFLKKWNPLKKEKRRKRKREEPKNVRVIYMKNAAGQQVKKYKQQPKESSRWKPPRPWVPYPTQATVEQVCTFLKLIDYPILVTEQLKLRYQDKQAFFDYALPLLRGVNPRAHPLILRTLVQAKWFEVMNTLTGHQTEEQSLPPIKRIKLNWSF